MFSRSTREAVLNFTGAVALVVGSYFPWAQPNPDATVLTMTPTTVFDNLHRGFEFGHVSYDAVVIGAATVAIIALGVTTREWVRVTATILSGGVVVLLCFRYLQQSTVGFEAMWMVTWGWYLTIAGGFLLVVNGVYEGANRLNRSAVDSTVST